MRVNKFHARKTPCVHGHTHASAKEARRCADLHLLQRSGKIAGLEIEPKFTFAIAGKPIMMGNNQPASYRPDFAYIENGVKVCEDIKGLIVRDFPLRIALARHLWPSIDWRVL